MVVIGALGTWTEAQLDVTDYVHKLAGFVDMLATLPQDTVFIFRTAPYFCCHAGNHHRYSHKRQLIFSTLYTRSVLGAFPGRAHVWDTRSASETQPWADTAHRAARCASNHLPVRLVEEDAQTFKHLVCHMRSRAR